MNISSKVLFFINNKGSKSCDKYNFAVIDEYTNTTLYNDIFEKVQRSDCRVVLRNVFIKI